MNDILRGGDAIVLQNLVPVPRGTSLLYDGRDRIQASFPIAVTRGAFPVSPGSLLAGGTEVLDTDSWGTYYIAPVGENTPDSSLTQPFESTQLYVMARLPNTEVKLNGVTIATIGEGENFTINDVKEDDVVETSSPVQIHLVTGDVGSTYEMRWYSLLPVAAWSNDYYTPVGEEVGPTGIWLYNPAGSEISVSYDRDGATNQGPFTVAAHSTRFLRITNGGNIDLPGNGRSGLRFYSTGGAAFLALTQTDAANSGQLYDWGHPLIPADRLTSQALIGWGYGCTDNNCNQSTTISTKSRSIVWVTPVSAADIYTDFNGDGTVDSTIPARALQLVSLTDSDEDMTGARIFATASGSGLTGTPVDIAVAWGQDPVRSGSGDSGALDLGTVVPPLPLVDAAKSVELLTDRDGDGLPSPGDRLRYTIRVVNIGRVNVPSKALTITDTLPGDTSYVANSTEYFDGATRTPIADGGADFPLAGGGIENIAILPVDGAHEISFEVDVADFAGLTCGTTSIVNRGAVLQGAEVIDFEAVSPLSFRTDIRIEKTTNGVDGPTLDVGSEVTWNYQVSTTGNVFLGGVRVTDSDPAVIPVYLSGDGNDNGLLEPGEVWNYQASGTAIEGSYENLGTATGTPVYGDLDCTAGPGLENPSASDPSYYTGVIPANPAIDIEKATNGEDADFTPGPSLEAGTTVTWTYVVTNTGNVELTGVSVSDDQIATISCPQTTLAAGASMTCTATGIAVEGQYVNEGTVSATSPKGEFVTDTDPSHYLGTEPDMPAIDVEKATNGEDADTGPGPTLTVGTAVTWTYVVTNTGNVALDNVAVSDDKIGAIACPQTTLAAAESMTCSATGTAVEGQYGNLATVVASPPKGEAVTDTDASHYFGKTAACDGSIDIEKKVKASSCVGCAVTYEITVTNTGSCELAGVAVTDELAPVCDKTIGSLGAGQSVTYTCKAPRPADSVLSFKDNFSQRSFDNNNGNVMWAGPWTEVDKANQGGQGTQDPLTGNVTISGSYELWLDDNPDTGAQPLVSRRADLTGATSATLSFNWKTACGVDPDDKVVVEVSSNGGASYKVLRAFTGFQGCNNGIPVFNINGYISDQTRVRFRVVSGYGEAKEVFKVDNLCIVAKKPFTNRACVSATYDDQSASDCAEVVLGQ